MAYWVPMPQLFVDIGRVLYIGTWNSTAEHTPMVPIIGAGLDRTFLLNIDGEDTWARTAIVPAGVPRTVDAFGERLAVMPVDPLQVSAEVHGDQAIDALRTLADAESFSQDAWDALGRATPHTAFEEVGPTVREAAQAIDSHVAENLPGSEIAQRVGYSLPHLQAMFRSELGVSMRSYRVWGRLRRVAQQVQVTSTLTEAATPAGFYDAARFTNSFVATFGITPTSVFSPDLRIHLVPNRLISETS